MRAESYILDLIEYKTAKIEKDLRRSAGLLIAAKNGVVVVLKSPNIYHFRIDIYGDCIFVWGIFGSASDKRDFQFEFEYFQKSFAGVFSERDLNRQVIEDFISTYMQEIFCELDSAHYSAAEFMVGMLSEKTIQLSIIAYDGKVTKPPRGVGTNIIGAGSQENKDKFLNKTKKFEFKNMDTMDLAKIAPKFLKYSFDGESQIWKVDVSRENTATDENTEKTTQENKQEDKKDAT